MIRPTMKQKRGAIGRYHFAKPANEELLAKAAPAKPMRSSITIRINLMHPICNAIFGKDHSLAHRLTTGAVVALLGVVVAKYAGHSSNAVAGHLGDMVGYGMHALGLEPFIKWIARKYE
jgi:hypothetical protein